MRPTTPRTITRNTTLALTAGLCSLAAADTVLIGTTTGAILGYDTETGEVSSVAQAATPVRALTTMNGMGYYADGAGTVSVFDLASGEPAGGFAASVDAAALASDGEWLFAADTDGEIQRIDPETGAVDASVTIGFANISALGVHWGNLYHGGLNTLAERAPLADAFPDNNFELFAICGGAINSMTFRGLDVVLGSLNGRIYRYNEFDGIYATDHFVDADSVGVAALVGGLVLVADSSGTLLEVDLETGAIVRTADAGAPIGAIHPLDVGASCPADLDLSGVLDLGDVQTFIMLAIDGRLGADLDGDDVVDLTDVGLFANSFAAGCE